MKILIIATYFPPQNSVASLRPYSWAKYWSRAGHDVTVLTTRKHDHPTNTVYPYTGFAVREVEMPFFNLLRGSLGKKSAEKYTDSKNMPKAKLRAFAVGVINKMIQWLQTKYGVLNACRMPDLTDLWVEPAFQAVANERWDLVISSAWPYTVHRVAYKLRKAGIAKLWIADWRDLWTENHLYPGIWPFTIFEKRSERFWMTVADFITTVSDPLALVLERKYGSKVSVIYNGFDPEDYENLPKERSFPQDGVFRIIYTGSVYADKQDPSALFQAIARLHEAGHLSPHRLQIIFYGNNADMRTLAKEMNIVDYVQYGGFLPRQQVLHFQRDADALLFLEFKSDHVQGILTGKLFEYLFAGPPILSVGIGSDMSASTVLNATGRGGSFGENVDTLAQRIHELVDGKANGLERHLPVGEERRNSAVIQYSRKRQAEKLIGLVSDT
ncbi:MAG: glycosyltransferase [Anaerolineales bacterium]|jgi:glycosyltransferase involved in cell wall biosynthesis|nr:glycosyltransferase [Anaerolineales bacterium]